MTVQALIDSMLAACAEAGISPADAEVYVDGYEGGIDDPEPPGDTS